MPERGVIVTGGWEQTGEMEGLLEQPVNMALIANKVKLVSSTYCVP